MESLLHSWTGHTIRKNPIFHKPSPVIFPKCYLLTKSCLSSSSKIQPFYTTCHSSCRKLLVVSAAKKSTSWSAPEPNLARFRARLFGTLLLGFGLGSISTSLWVCRYHPSCYVYLALFSMFIRKEIDRLRLEWQ